MTDDATPDLGTLLAARYVDAPRVDVATSRNGTLRGMAQRVSCRAFLDTAVPPGWVETLCAAALASPSKSDLQQRDIVVLQSPKVRQALAALVPGQPWVADAPMIAVFCGNNRRQRVLHEWHGVGFANDHLDAFFNATGDAAIALGAFVTAAEAMGLGCCPISAVRNEARAVSQLLDLPKYVFPFAGLALGFPAHAPRISQRLPLGVTCHIDRYCEDDLREAVQAYDDRRAVAQPYATQRAVQVFGEKDVYAWSDDKVRQYSQPERDTFGEYVRTQGFKLD